MSWRDQLRSASFRGIPFKIFSASTSVGRRNVVHQYPFRDKPLIEDMGQDADEFTIQGFILANVDNNQDYFNERDSLISALREKGPGTLIHPFYGELEVSLLGKSPVVENFSEGGIARFSMTFIQAEANQFPFQDVDNVGAVNEVASKSLEQIENSFGEKYNSAGPSFISGTSLTNFTSYNKMQQAALLAIKGTATINATRQTLNNILSQVSSKLSAPCNYATSFINSMRAFANTATGVSAVSTITGKCTGVVQSATSAVSSFSGTSKIGNKLGISAAGALLSMTVYGNPKT